MPNSSFNFTNLNGTNGFQVLGLNNIDLLGFSVNLTTDINGDGVADLLIGAPFANPNSQTDAGITYVIFGKKTNFSATFDLTTLNGSNGLAINGVVAGGISGNSIAAIRDINGDGINDIAIGAPLVSVDGKNAAGRTYIVYGKTSGFNASLDLSALDGNNGFVLNGIDPNDTSGFAVSSAGDINGDGLADLLVGARNADPGGRIDAGEAYVVFGKNGGFGASLELSSLNGSNGFIINGANTQERFSFATNNVGDFNGDGVDDLVFGSPNASPDNKGNAGAAYVIFGKKTAFAGTLEVSSLNGTNGFLVKGLTAGDRLGFSVSGAGDVNGDGLKDVVIGAFEASPNGKSRAGASYVIFGKNGGVGASFDLSSINGSNGFVVDGYDAGDNSGNSVVGIGDVNGDTLDDLALGAPNADPKGLSAGESSIIFGTRNGFSAAIFLGDLGSKGFVFKGNSERDLSGQAVSGGGDINGDGIKDIAIGSPTADFGDRTDNGAVYVVFGNNTTLNTGANPPLQVENFQSTDSGFSVQFNQTINTTVLNLYDGADTAIDLPDLRLLSINGQEIKGSAIWNETTKTLTFVKTGGVFDDGKYNLTLFSRDDAFINSLGQRLDGDGDTVAGGDFNAQFTINKTATVTTETGTVTLSKRVLSLSDFSRGPKQSINLPGNTTDGIPIKIDNAENVTKLILSISYDADILKIDTNNPVSLAANLPSSWKITSVSTTTPGQVNLTAEGEALTAGARNLISLKASVSETATYGQTEIIKLDAQLNNGLLPVSGDWAIHQVTYLGDTNGDRAYTNADIPAISRIAVGLDSGLDNLPLIDPVIVGDATSNGQLSGLDASFVARTVSGLSQLEIPPIV
jgi:hypothetical protein